MNNLADNANDLSPRGKRGATILVVEDEAMMREIVVLMLRNLGHELLEAANGIEGLRICRERRQRIDLIVTDVEMPGMNGEEFLRRARGIRGDFKVVVMSGYTDRLIIRNGKTEEGDPFLQKPFEMSLFYATINSLLELQPDERFGS